VQSAPFARTLALLLPLGLLAVSFPSCSSSSASEASDGGGDDNTAISLDSTLPSDDSDLCDPCEQVCPCTLSDTFYNAAQCETVVCGPSLMWGGVSCSGGPGCPPDADDGAECDPCVQVCACLPGQHFFNKAQCMEELCGDGGTWGGISCETGPGCDGGSDAASSEAGADAAPGPEASVEAGAD
jgi:hypothetical protein